MTGTLAPVKPGRKPTINLEIQFPTHSPAPTMVKAIVDTNPMSGKHLKSWADKLSTDTKDAVEAALRDGLAQGKTTDQIVRSIIGTKANKYTDGIMQGSRKSIDAMVRTAINHVHNVAAQLSYTENEDVIKGWKYLSVLDNRTTRFCAAHDGKKYKLGQGPIPPNHVRCRSLCQPVTLTMRELGVDVEEGTSLTRASMDGPVSGDITYDTWLKGRTVAEQDDLLGKARGAAFRAGKIRLDDLYKNDGREYTLKELRARHPTAF
ncbi:minor capsid protein [Sphingomonas aurantiaca]|uniref:minor capsid protein n=1 Tax=Sphingomonas aurantiaca TaxID=185949 RepID=UPI002FE115C7